MCATRRRVVHVTGARRMCATRYRVVHVTPTHAWLSLYLMPRALSTAPQSPFKRAFTAHVHTRVAEMPGDGSAGSFKQLQVEARELRSGVTTMDTVFSHAKLFAVLERVIVAVTAGENALWKNGSVFVPGASQEQQIIARDRVPYAFVGRMLPAHRLPDAKVVSESWLLPQRSGVRLVRPESVRFEPWVAELA